MDVQTISNIVLSSLSVILVIVSVCIAVATLKQNSKIIESSTRPYVGFKIERIDTGTDRFLFILKNYGSSAAIIKSFDPGIDANELKIIPTELAPFEGIENTTLLPGQVLSSVINYKALKAITSHLTATILYTSSTGKEYLEKIPINIEMNSGFVSSRTDTKGGELKSISYSLQEIVERIV